MRPAEARYRSNPASEHKKNSEVKEYILVIIHGTERAGLEASEHILSMRSVILINQDPNQRLSPHPNAKRKESSIEGTEGRKEADKERKGSCKQG